MLASRVKGKRLAKEAKGTRFLGSMLTKGYIADEIVEVLQENGVEQSIIDIGGNIYALGMKYGTDQWTIGIQNPLSDRGEIIGTIKVNNMSIVTSGIYERYIEEDGVKYHHILNPKTGYPYDTELEGVTIIADKSKDADALSTLVFTKDLQGGLEFVENHTGAEAIFITHDKEVYITSGVEDVFTITDTEFTIIN